MCTGCNSKTPVAPAQPGVTPAEVTSETWYRVTYFNGTTEDVQGMDTVRQRIITPASRAPDTDRDGLQGGTAHPL